MEYRGPYLYNLQASRSGGTIRFNEFEEPTVISAKRAHSSWELPPTEGGRPEESLNVVRPRFSPFSRWVFWRRGPWTPLCACLKHLDHSLSSLPIRARVAILRPIESLFP